MRFFFCVLHHVPFNVPTTTIRVTRHADIFRTPLEILLIYAVVVTTRTLGSDVKMFRIVLKNLLC